MSYPPESLQDLRTYLQAKTGLGPVSLGIVGDSRHLRGYHCGKDRIMAGAGWLDYSVKTARDRAGLSDAAMAMDIGNHKDLRRLSLALVDACRARAPGTTDIREVIFSPDGQTVLRYDRERGPQSEPRPGEADASHRTHTHVSWYRDSEKRDKVSVFRALYDDEGEDMGVNATPDGPTIAGIFRCTKTAQTIPANGSSRGELPAGAVRHALGPWLLVDLDDRRCYAISEDGELAYVAADAGTFTPMDPSPDDGDEPMHVALWVDGATVYEGDF